MEESIKIKNLNVNYGNKEVLKDINLDIEKGMYGLLGRNGAGKTTLMKSIIGLIQIKSGEVSLLGIDLKDKKRIRNIIGYLPQNFEFYPNMTVKEGLKYLGVLNGCKFRDLKNNIEKLLELVNLSEVRDRKIGKLSGGMKRRFGIAQTLLNDPKIIIVDEPTAGLDPEERIRFRNVLAKLAEEKTVLLSTHIASDIESTCRNVAILNNGRIMYSGDILNLIEKSKGLVYSVKVLKEDYKKLEEKYIVFSRKDNISFIEAKVLHKGKPREDFISIEPTLESAYLNVIYDEGGIR